MVLTASFVLSPVIGLSCHRPRRDAKHHRQVDASVEASGPHDLAVHLTRVRLFAPKASTASPPNVRDDRETPLLIGHGMGRILPVIWEGDQRRGLRPINTTGKSGAAAAIVSSDRQLLRVHLVMAGLDPAIHVFASRKGSKTWITGHRRAEATPFFLTAMPGDDGGECPGSLLPQGRLWSRIALDTPAPRFVNRTLLALTRDGRAHSSAGERSLHTGEVQGSIPCAPTMPSMKSVA